jgi:hypothetical protein
VHRSLALMSLLVGLSWGSSVASAQQGGSKIHIGAGLVLDVGGEVDFDAPGFNDFDLRGRGWEDDLDATFGLRGHLDYALHKYVSVGGLVRMSWWEPDDLGIDRSFLFDIGPRVIGHYDWRDFRFYVGLSPGLTISAINDDGNFAEFDNPAAGFTLSVTLAGAEWWFSRSLGLFLELGYVGHWFEHDIDGAVNGAGDVEFALGQMMLETGLVFGL